MALDELNEMRVPVIDKVVVHMSVGESGEELGKAEDILEEITGQRSVRTEAKMSLPELGIRRGEPIGCKVTLRGDAARDFLDEAFGIAGSIKRTSFDRYGNFSFGIKEHTDFEGMEYDPAVGIYGMDVTVALTRRGKRVERRKQRSKRIPEKQRLNIEDAVSFVEEELGVEIE